MNLTGAAADATAVCLCAVLVGTALGGRPATASAHPAQAVPIYTRAPSTRRLVAYLWNSASRKPVVRSLPVHRGLLAENSPASRCVSGAYVWCLDDLFLAGEVWRLPSGTSRWRRFRRFDTTAGVESVNGIMPAGDGDVIVASDHAVTMLDPALRVVAAADLMPKLVRTINLSMAGTRIAVRTATVDPWKVSDLPGPPFNFLTPLSCSPFGPSFSAGATAAYAVLMGRHLAIRAIVSAGNGSSILFACETSPTSALLGVRYGASPSVQVVRLALPRSTSNSEAVVAGRMPASALSSVIWSQLCGNHFLAAGTVGGPNAMRSVLYDFTLACRISQTHRFDAPICGCVWLKQRRSVIVLLGKPGETGLTAQQVPL